MVPGRYELRVGASSRDIRLRGTVQHSGLGDPGPDLPAVAAEYRDPGFPLWISGRAFGALYGGNRPLNVRDHAGHYTPNTPIEDMQDSAVTNWIFQTMQFQLKHGFTVKPGDPVAIAVQNVMRDTPLRSLIMMTDGVVSPETLSGVTELLNGRWASGAARIAAGLLPGPKGKGE
ncbi:hypothetical protein ACFP81_01975 [Deinococcus lacus]|uniref:Uncharacterized protein n=1 Tax=Deinococcus lacus TaxID=392561 RepID=A0ABW1Y9Q5_9DEIO